MSGNQAESAARASTEQVINTIRETRNALINALLNDTSLLAFAELHFNTVALSTIKTEFLKRDLAELLDSSLDLVHYSALVRESKQQNIRISSNHPLLLTEIFSIFSKYGVNRPE
jgi:chorismate-pyruvate lyase